MKEEIKRIIKNEEFKSKVIFDLLNSYKE